MALEQLLNDVSSNFSNNKDLTKDSSQVASSITCETSLEEPSNTSSSFLNLSSVEKLSSSFSEGKSKPTSSLAQTDSSQTLDSFNYPEQLKKLPNPIQEDGASQLSSSKVDESSTIVCEQMPSGIAEGELLDKTTVSEEQTPSSRYEMLYNDLELSDDSDQDSADGSIYFRASDNIKNFPSQENGDACNNKSLSTEDYLMQSPSIHESDKNAASCESQCVPCEDMNDPNYIKSENTNSNDCHQMDFSFKTGPSTAVTQKISVRTALLKSVNLDTNDSGLNWDSTQSFVGGGCKMNNGSNASDTLEHLPPTLKNGCPYALSCGSDNGLLDSGVSSCCSSRTSSVNDVETVLDVSSMAMTLRPDVAAETSINSKQTLSSTETFCKIENHEPPTKSNGMKLYERNTIPKRKDQFRKGKINTSHNSILDLMCTRTKRGKKRNYSFITSESDVSDEPLINDTNCNTSYKNNKNKVPEAGRGIISVTSNPCHALLDTNVSIDNASETISTIEVRTEKVDELDASKGSTNGWKRLVENNIYPETNKMASNKYTKLDTGGDTIDCTQGSVEKRLNIEPGKTVEAKRGRSAVCSSSLNFLHDAIGDEFDLEVTSKPIDMDISSSKYSYDNTARKSIEDRAIDCCDSRTSKVSEMCLPKFCNTFVPVMSNPADKKRSITKDNLVEGSNSLHSNSRAQRDTAITLTQSLFCGEKSDKKNSYSSSSNHWNDEMDSRTNHQSILLTSKKSDSDTSVSAGHNSSASPNLLKTIPLAVPNPPLTATDTSLNSNSISPATEKYISPPINCLESSGLLNNSYSLIEQKPSHHTSNNLNPAVKNVHDSVKKGVSERKRSPMTPNVRLSELYDIMCTRNKRGRKRQVMKMPVETNTDDMLQKKAMVQDSLHVENTTYQKKVDVNSDTGVMPRARPAASNSPNSSQVAELVNICKRGSKDTTEIECGVVLKDVTTSNENCSFTNLVELKELSDHNEIKKDTHKAVSSNIVSPAPYDVAVESYVVVHQSAGSTTSNLPTSFAMSNTKIISAAEENAEQKMSMLSSSTDRFCNNVGTSIRPSLSNEMSTNILVSEVNSASGKPGRSISAIASAEQPALTPFASTEQPALSTIASTEQPALSTFASTEQPALTTFASTEQPALSTIASTEQPALSTFASAEEPYHSFEHHAHINPLDKDQKTSILSPITQKTVLTALSNKILSVLPSTSSKELYVMTVPPPIKGSSYEQSTLVTSPSKEELASRFSSPSTSILQRILTPPGVKSTLHCTSNSQTLTSSSTGKRENSEIKDTVIPSQTINEKGNGNVPVSLLRGSVQENVNTMPANAPFKEPKINVGSANTNVVNIYSNSQFAHLGTISSPPPAAYPRSCEDVMDVLLPKGYAIVKLDDQGEPCDVVQSILAKIRSRFRKDCTQSDDEACAPRPEQSVVEVPCMVSSNSSIGEGNVTQPWTITTPFESSGDRSEERLDLINFPLATVGTYAHTSPLTSDLGLTADEPLSNLADSVQSQASSLFAVASVVDEHVDRTSVTWHEGETLASQCSSFQVSQADCTQTVPLSENMIDEVRMDDLSRSESTISESVFTIGNHISNETYSNMAAATADIPVRASNHVTNGTAAANYSTANTALENLITDVAVNDVPQTAATDSTPQAASNGNTILVPGADHIDTDTADSDDSDDLFMAVVIDSDDSISELEESTSDTDVEECSNYLKNSTRHGTIVQHVVGPIVACKATQTAKECVPTSKKLHTNSRNQMLNVLENSSNKSSLSTNRAKSPSKKPRNMNVNKRASAATSIPRGRKRVYADAELNETCRSTPEKKAKRLRA